MTIIYAKKIARKIIEAPIRKDRHVSYYVEQNIIPSLIGSTKTVGKVLPKLYRKFIGNLYEILNHQ